MAETERNPTSSTCDVLPLTLTGDGTPAALMRAADAVGAVSNGSFGRRGRRVRYVARSGAGD